MALTTSLYVSGFRDEDKIHVPASSLVLLFSLQASCPTLPVDVVLVERYCHSVKENLSVSNTNPDKPLQENVNGIEQHLSSININENVADTEFDFPGEDVASWKSLCLFPIAINSLSFPIHYNIPCPHMVDDTVLPAVLSETDKWCVVGMCSSLRYILQQAHEAHNNEFAKKLLGFREGCLQSCAEVSCWTKYCEVEMPEALQDAFCHISNKSSVLEIPKVLLRYNNHMARPPILHNALKMKQEVIRKTVKDKKERNILLQKKMCELPDLDHDYAEGIDITIADVMLVVCFDLILDRLSELKLDAIAPLVAKWHELILSSEGVLDALPILHEIKLKYEGSKPCSDSKCVLPEVLEESLYKSDPERPKLHCVGSMTLQRDIDKVFQWLNDAGVTVEYSQPSVDDSISLPWTSYPPAVHPQEGSLPPSRLLRKCQQLENIVSEVMKVCKPGDRIVDFCAGGGHVGIVLAFCLPQCSVILVENKSSSLIRAKTRVDTLGLNNVHYYQCNLDYFLGPFDIGVCLHACGQATDLVLQKCYNKEASFVCSPCCYGSIQPNHSVQYPRSNVFRSVLDRLSDYLTLGHAADQTHGPEHPSTAQGQLCMRYIDTDRLEHASQLGYNTKLMIMTPGTCSPKNHMLIGSIVTKIVETVK